MTPRKLKVAIATFPYGGNGAVSSEFPHVGNWRARTMMKIMKDERCDDDVVHIELCDTPITMTRNRAVLLARRSMADVLVMIDSDMYPDHSLVVGDAYAKPFWDTSFDYLYKHWERGPVVIGAPYCGASPNNNIFVFRWSCDRNESVKCVQDMKIQAFGREEAAIKTGIEGVAALPTGLIMFDMRIFKLTEPANEEKGPLARGWFYYDWKDKYAAEKASTEDVTVTRDMSLMGQLKLGYNPVFCNWDAWAGHVKQEIVPKPYPITIEQIESRYRTAARAGLSDHERMMDVGEDGVDPKLDENPINLQRLTAQIAAAPPLTSWGKVDPKTMSKDVLDGWLERLNLSHPDDDAVLTGIVASLAEGGKKIEVIEVGSFLGKSAERIIKACNGRCRLHCVDTWLGDNDTVTIDGKEHRTTSHVANMCNAVYGDGGLRMAFEERMAPYLMSHVCMIQKTSVQAAKDWPAGKLVDMVYIDADHTYESVKEDIEAWYPKVRPGGIICGHDYGGAIDFPGVKKAVDELIPDRNVEAAVWWYRVPVTTTNRIGHHYKGKNLRWKDKANGVIDIAKTNGKHKPARRAKKKTKTPAKTGVR